MPLLRLDSSPYLFKCHSCKKVTRLTHDTFIKLPLHTPLALRSKRKAS